MSELKSRLIAEITRLNSSARVEFLAEFTEEELQSYLTRLQEVWDEFRAQFNKEEPFIHQFDVVGNEAVLA